MRQWLVAMIVAAMIILNTVTVSAGDRWFFVLEGEPGTWYWRENCYTSTMVTNVTTHIETLTTLPKGDQIASIASALPATSTTEFIYIDRDAAGNYRLEWCLNIDEVNRGEYISPGGWWWEVPGIRRVFQWKWLNPRTKTAPERIFEEAYSHGKKMIPYRKGPPEPNYVWDERMDEGSGH